MTVDETRLDGNAAAGLLSTIFAGDVTLIRITCNGCGTIALVGDLHAYSLEMGAILRCPACGDAVLRVGLAGDRVCVDLRHASRLTIVTGS